MKTLDLTNPDKSDIKYKISKFPDGQQNIIIDINSEDVYFGHGFIKNQIEIKTRINNWLDLEILCCAVAALRQLGVKEIHLNCPIIIGSRSDRKFENGGNNYLKQVICPIINSLKFESVTCFDAHSTCSEMGFDNFQNTSNVILLRHSLGDLYAHNQAYKTENNNFTLISPDAGATHKIYKLAEQIGYKGDIITCTKERNEKGELKEIRVPFSVGKHLPQDLIVIDDICDGGKTFINIAKDINKQISAVTSLDNKIIGKKYLIVSHLLHELPNPEIFEYFDMVFTTNSRHDIYYEKGKDYTKEHSKVKVLNIF